MKYHTNTDDEHNLQRGHDYLGDHQQRWRTCRSAPDDWLTSREWENNNGGKQPRKAALLQHVGDMLQR